MILKYPVNYIAVTQYFKQGIHNGLDLGWKSNQFEPIYAAADGEVVGVINTYATNDSSGSSYGNYVKIKHDETFSTLYAHLKLGSVNVKVGDKVKQGEQIGLMGNTGHAFGNHLHYEVFVNGVKSNPQDYTYVFEGQTISQNTSAIENLKYYIDNGEKNSNNNIEIDKLKKQLQELTDKNKMLNNEVVLLQNELKENENYIFKYDCTKTATYKIKLYEGEQLLIKN